MSIAIPVDSELVATPNVTESSEVSAQRNTRGRFVAGNRGNPMGGKPRRIRELERMLDREHRNVDASRELFARLRALALGEVILVPVVTANGEMQLTAKLEPDAAFMKLYLDRVYGPVKSREDDMDLSDAPSEVIEYLRVRLSR